MAPLPAAKIGEAGRENIGFQDCDIGCLGDLLSHYLNEVRVDFEGDYLPGSRSEKLGHRAPSGANLADKVILPDRQGRDDALLEQPVVEKMLSKFWANHGEDCTSSRVRVCAARPSRTHFDVARPFWPSPRTGTMSVPRGIESLPRCRLAFCQRARLY